MQDGFCGEWTQVRDSSSMGVKWRELSDEDSPEEAPFELVRARVGQFGLNYLCTPRAQEKQRQLPEGVLSGNDMCVCVRAHACVHVLLCVCVYVRWWEAAWGKWMRVASELPGIEFWFCKLFNLFTSFPTQTVGQMIPVL